MSVRESLTALGVSLIGAVVLGITLQALSVTVNGVTLTWPSYPKTGDPLISCEPWEDATANTITIDGTPANSTVRVSFVIANPYTNVIASTTNQTFSGGASLVVAVPYPQDPTLWPSYNAATHEAAIEIGVTVDVRDPSGTLIARLISKPKWWVRCTPPPPDAEGCTPGYWRQDQHFDSWVPTGYATSDDFEVVFGVNASFDPHTLLDAVWLGGGGENALARHAVAALLNAAHPDVNYTYTVAQVIAMVQSAYNGTADVETTKDLFDAANNAGCDLN